MPFMPPFVAPTRHSDPESALAQVRAIYDQQIAHLRAAMQRRPIGDAVVHAAQVGQVEDVLHEHAALRRQRAFDVLVLAERKMDRDGLRAGADLQLDAMVALEQPELLQVVIRIQVGARERGFETAGARNESVREA